MKESEEKTQIVTEARNFESMSSIRRLDERTIRKVSTEAVLPDVTSVVKELLENALDAHASTVRVRFVGDVFHVEVADDGRGVAAADYASVCRANTTSKLASLDDLAAVTTLGFRGQALHALCAHARVTLLTRTDALAPITELQFDERGELVASLERDADVRLPRAGTVVIAEDLFATTPVRATVQRQRQAQHSAALEQLSLHYGLLFPDVDLHFDFAAVAGGRTLHKGRVATLDDAIALLFGAKLRADVDALLVEHESFRARLFVPRVAPAAVAGVLRSTNDRSFVSLNRRPIDFSPVSSLVTQHFRRHFDVSRKYPFVVCCIECAPSLADVNVSADKRKVHLLIADELVAAIEARLAAHTATAAAPPPPPPPTLEPSLRVPSPPRAATTPQRPSQFNDFVFGADRARQQQQQQLPPPPSSQSASQSTRAARPAANVASSSSSLLPPPSNDVYDVSVTAPDAAVCAARVRRHNAMCDELPAARIVGSGKRKSSEMSGGGDTALQLVGRLNRLDERRGCDGDVVAVRRGGRLFAVSLSRARETVAFETLCSTAAVSQQELPVPVQLMPSTVPTALWPVVERRHELAIARLLMLNGFTLCDGDGESVQLTHIAVRDSSATSAPLSSLIELLRLIAQSDELSDVRRLRTSESLRAFRAAARASGNEAASGDDGGDDDALLRDLLRVRPQLCGDEDDGAVCPHENALCVSLSARV